MASRHPPTLSFDGRDVKYIAVLSAYLLLGAKAVVLPSGRMRSVASHETTHTEEVTPKIAHSAPLEVGHGLGVLRLKEKSHDSLATKDGRASRPDPDPGRVFLALRRRPLGGASIPSSVRVRVLPWRDSRSPFDIGGSMATASGGSAWWEYFQRPANKSSIELSSFFLMTLSFFVGGFSTAFFRFL